MDIASLTEGMGFLKMALDALHRAKELMPEGSKKEEAGVALAQAERQLRIAESEIANKLDYELCRKHFPPEIMLSADDYVWRCPNCGNKKDHSPTGTVVDVDLYGSRDK